LKFQVSITKPVVGDIWERLSDVLEYWQNIKKDEALPSWHRLSFNIADLNPQAIPYVAAFDVLESGFRIRFFGTQRVWLQGRDYTGCLLSDYKPEMIALKIDEELKMVLQSKEPMLVTTKRTDPDSDEILTYEFLYLPLAKNGEDIDIIFTLGLNERDLKTLHKEYDQARRQDGWEPYF